MGERWGRDCLSVDEEWRGVCFVGSDELVGGV